MTFYSLLFFISWTLAILNPQETGFLCKYDGVTGFPVPCSDAANACSYSGVQCVPQSVAPLWNESISGLNLVLLFNQSFTNVLPSEIGLLTMLSSLSMSTSSLVPNSAMPTEIGLCTRLTYLMMAGVAFTGTLPTELFNNVKQLALLELALTGLTGTLPNSLSTLTALTYLSLAYNDLSGTVPSIESLKQLQRFSLDGNLFSGYLPDPSQLPNLRTYSVANNRFIGGVPVFNATSLQSVDLSHNLLNGSLPNIPIVYSATSAAFYFTANANQLTGTIPASLFDTPLITLDLSYNRLTGAIPKELIRAVQLEQLVLSHNLLDGSLPIEWQGALFPALFRLNMDHNTLSGSVPGFTLGGAAIRSVTYQPHIYLNMNDNAFTGALPDFGSFAMSASLDFSNNALTINSDSFGRGVNISWLSLAHNPLLALPSSGLFSDVTSFRAIVTLDISYCQLTGTLPEFFRAQYLKLNNNYFTGIVRSNFIYQTDPSKLPVFADIRLNRLETDATRETHLGSVSAYLSGEVVITDFPQDVDECALATHECEYLCIDGWFPVPGYTCACPSGYAIDEVGKHNCSAVCGDGILSYPEELCDYEYSKIGCTRNCTPKLGYLCDALGCSPICGDGLVMEPEECDNASSSGCSVQCKVVIGYTCDPATNICQACSQSWVPFIYPPNLQLFGQFRGVVGDDLTDFDFASCVSCVDGYALETRAVLAAKYCYNMSTQRSLPCSFACSNLTVFRSATESIFTLQQEFMKGSFLKLLFRTLFNVNITFNSTVSDQASPKKRASSTTPTPQFLQFTLSPCVADKSSMVDVLRALSLDIVPNLPSLTLLPTACGIDLRAIDPPPEAILSIALVVGVTVLFAVAVIIGAITFYYSRSELHALPNDVSWSFMDQLTHPWRWCYEGNNKSGYYSRVYDKKSVEYERVESLLKTHFKKGALVVGTITAIYNPALSVSFVNHWKLMTTRKRQSPDLFFSRTYTRDSEKMKVMSYYEKDLLQFTPYNQALTVPLIPVLHGTDFTIAEKIAQTGFAALSSLDEGYFGKGIYFTTSLLYTLPYACNKRRPAAIISFVNMGNVYPVTEDHKGCNSLRGTALKSGYHSHLICTNKNGAIYKERDDTLCDEIIVGQESQILPAFIVEMDHDSCISEFEKWQRDLPPVLPDAALKAHQNKYLPPKYATSTGGDDTLPFSMVSMDENYPNPVYDI